MKSNVKKNVIIFHTDEQRYDSLGCTGNEYAMTPNIDRLAAEGTLFTRHIVSNPICMPSRASLNTGLYPPGHNVWSNGVALNRKQYVNPNSFRGSLKVDEPVTIADMFAEAGYNTAGFGKFHLTPTRVMDNFIYPESQEAWEKGLYDDWHGPYYGFEYVEIVKGHGEFPCKLGHYANWLKKEHPEIYRQVLNKQKEKPVGSMNNLYPSPVPNELHNSNWLADQVCNYIGKQKEDEKPFFAFVGFPDPHHPFTPSYDIVNKFKDIPVKIPYDMEGKGVQSIPYHTLNERNSHPSKLTLEEQKTILRYIYAMIYQIDLAIGKVIDYLQNIDFWENTIIIFTSDHGDYLCDHGLIYKSQIASDTLLHVPFILRVPGESLPEQVDICMSNCDVMPTLAYLTDINSPDNLDGENIISKIEIEKEDNTVFTYAGNGKMINYTIYGKEHRFSWYPKINYQELYHHGEDPAEINNIAGCNPDFCNELKTKIKNQLFESYNPINGKISDW